ncbi:winged helix-turn-helix domain-containing protein [Chloroflexota bacterium]
MQPDEKDNETAKEMIAEVNALSNVDRLIHEPARLVILALLSVVDSAGFNYALKQTQLSRGNLSVQMTKLEEAGYLTIEKKFIGKRPYTVMRISEAGRKAFEEYRQSVVGALSNL